MPTVTNLNLRFSNTSSEEWITVRVTYTINFNSTEVFAGVIYKEVVMIYPDDNYPTSGIGVATTTIKAGSESVHRNQSTIVRKLRLNEDPDIEITTTHNGNIIVRPVEKPDEWIARVRFSPLVFEPVSFDSPVTTGSWGEES